MCENCGNEFSTWSGRCEACGEWNSLKEVNFDISDSSFSKNSERFESQRLSDIKIGKSFRTSTGISELDRVLGGGIVSGSLILLGGEPGIGKSTLVLEVIRNIDNVLYLTGEESPEQIKSRADRMGLKNINTEIVASGEIENLEREMAKKMPALLIIDSIQTVYLNSINSTPGSLVQVRECGMFLQKMAKKLNLPILIIGHVTKDGTIAGPRILEHIVDVVLYLEGERFHDARILRGIKNRFGATNEVGVFKMEEKGLLEIINPSKLFLDERENKPGSVITATMEGTRPILVEIQTLTNVTNFGFPKRTASGFDVNRLNLLAAVISRHTKVNMQNVDIYLNVVGGIKIKEPAIDAAVCASMMSSYFNKTFKENVCIYGEAGLLGEIRTASRNETRAKESKSLGFEILNNIKNISQLSEMLK